MSDSSDNPYAPPNFETVRPNSALIVDDELADRGTRLVASLLDGIIMFPPLLILLILISRWWPDQFLFGLEEGAMDQQEPLVGRLLFSAIGIAVFLAVNGSLLAIRGQTVGKYLMKIQIVDQETGKLLSMLRVYVYRYLWMEPISHLLMMVSGVPEDQIYGVLALIDVLFIFGAARLCLHDHFAYSKVVKFQPNRPRLN